MHKNDVCDGCEMNDNEKRVLLKDIDQQTREALLQQRQEFIVDLDNVLEKRSQETRQMLEGITGRMKTIAENKVHSVVNGKFATIEKRLNSVDDKLTVANNKLTIVNDSLKKKIYDVKRKTIHGAIETAIAKKPFRAILLLSIVGAVVLYFLYDLLRHLGYLEHIKLLVEFMKGIF